MKGFKKLVLFIIVSLFALNVLCACGSSNSGNGGGIGGDGNHGGNENPGESGGENPGEVGEVFSAALFDGKIANFLGADAVAIEKRDVSADVKAEARSFNPVVRAAGEEETTVTGTQPQTEFVKETPEGEITEIRFHEGVKSYRELNGKFGKHHHGGKECSHENCERVSDELREAEQDMPSVYSLDSRINKLYSFNNFTFMNISKAIEGNLNIKSYAVPVGNYMQTVYTWEAAKMFPTLVNIEKSYLPNSYEHFQFTTIEVKENDKKGIIPMKMSSNEESYHTSNYWSDEYNQSYIIDNATGMTYSLSRFPYIYSVENGVIKVYSKKTIGGFEYYIPSVHNGEINFNKIEIPQDEKFEQLMAGSTALVDKFGNVIFESWMYMSQEVNESGDVKMAEHVWGASPNRQIYESLRSSNNTEAAERYRITKRYFLGSDQKIYKLDYRGNLWDMPVSVLNAEGDWEPVAEDAEVTFSSGWFNYDFLTGFGGLITVTGIGGGKLYLANALWGNGITIIKPVIMRNYNQDRYYNQFYGVAAVPLSGGADEDLITLMRECNSSYQDFENRAWREYLRVGGTCMIYPAADGRVFRWDRKTGVNEEFSGGKFNIVNGMCFGCGNGYFPFDDEGITMEQGFQEPLVRTVELDQYYSLLKNENQ